MQKTIDIHLKKIIVISSFIFLFGLFSGLFFCTGLSEDNGRYLSALLISSINDGIIPFFKALFFSMISNYLPAALMLASALTKLLCPLPFLILWYESFTVGFCSGLVFLSETDNALLISLLNIVPPTVFIFPAFIAIASAAFIYSRHQIIKTKRSFREKKDLHAIILVSLASIAVGCIMDAICGLFVV